MPLPRGLARFNRQVTNRIQRHVAGVLPGFGLVTHTGRRSGQRYTVPLNVFPADGGFAILIAYGRHSDWLCNLQAAGGGEVVHRRRRYVLGNPRVVSGAEGLALLPLAGRLIARVARADEVLRLSAVPG